MRSSDPGMLSYQLALSKRYTGVVIKIPVFSTSALSGGENVKSYLQRNVLGVVKPITCVKGTVSTFTLIG